MVEAQMPEVEDKLTLARIAAAKYWQTGDDFDEHAARSILSGAWDDQAYVQAALAGIEAGLEMAATVYKSGALPTELSRQPIRTRCSAPFRPIGSWRDRQGGSEQSGATGHTLAQSRHIFGHTPSAHCPGFARGVA